MPFRSSGMMDVNVPTMVMMPFHTEVGLDMLWFAPWMPRYSTSFFFLLGVVLCPLTYTFMISTPAATFGACVGLFFLAIFYRFMIACVGLKSIRNTANESWATSQNLPKLNKLAPTTYMRYPAFSWKTDLSIGLLEGLASFVGYALMLAVSATFRFSFGPKKKNCVC
jgi:Ctr copper transporter family protein